MIKPIIIVLFIAMIISLVIGFKFLAKEQGNPNSKHTLYLLGARITLAITLLVVIGYGLWSGQLAIGAPWHP